MTDWSIEQLEFYSTIDNSANNTKYIRFYIKIPDQEGRFVFDCLLSLAIGGKASKVFSENQIYAICSDNLLSKFISSIVKLSIFSQTPIENYVINQGFMAMPSGKMVFGLGKEILNADEDDPVISCSTIRLKNCDNSGEFVSYLDNLINSESFPPAAFIASLVSYVKPIFENELDEYGFTIYIYSESGFGKTEFAKLLSDIFEEHDNVVSLSSDKYAIKKVCTLKDTLIVIDDLNRTTSSRIKNANEAKVCDFIQMNQGGGSCYYKDVKVKLDHIAVITAEYVIENDSTVNRCLLVQLDRAFDSYELTTLKKEHGKYIAFLKDFILWLCQNYHKIADEAPYYKKKNIKSESIYNGQYRGVKRILRTDQILGITLDILKLYLKEKLSLTDEHIRNISEICQNSIDQCINDTLEHCPTENTKIGREFVDAILTGIMQGDIVSTDYNEFCKCAKKAKKEHCLQKYIFYFNKVFLCVEAEVLIKWLKNQLDLETIPTKQRVSNQLKGHGLLQISGGELTSKIPEDNKKKYYKMPLYSLKINHAEIAHLEPYEIHYSWDNTTDSSRYGSWADCSEEYSDEYSDEYYDDEDISDNDYDAPKWLKNRKRIER